MTEEERRLAELLHKAVPQPPRPISADDIAARVAARRRITVLPVQPWLPALAVACVLLAIAGTSVWLVGGRPAPSAPAARPSSTGAPADVSSSSSASSASSTSTPPSRSAGSTSSSARPPASSAGTSPRQTATSTRTNHNYPNPESSVIPIGVIGAFGAQLLNVAPIGPVIVGGAGAVYGLEPAKPDQSLPGLIDRFELANGVSTAQVQIDPNASWPPLVTSRALWLPVVTAGTVTIELLDPVTLRQTGSFQIAAVTPASAQPVLAASPGYSEILLGDGNQIYSLNPSSGAVEHQLSITGLVGGLAVSPDGSRLYAGANTGGGEPHLLILDLQHGLATLSDTVLPNSQDSPVVGHGAVTGLLATSGGAWVTVRYPYPTIQSAADDIVFAPLNDPGHPREAIPGGGLAATATLAGGAVFVSGLHQIECADPQTAAVRAHASQMGELGLSHNFYSVQLVGGRYYASFQTNGGDAGGAYVGLAVLHPPAACGG
jgi:hypothetical protein